MTRLTVLEHYIVTGSQYARTLDAAKLSESTAKRWQCIARRWSLEAVERYLSECFQHDKLPAQTKNRTEG